MRFLFVHQNFPGQYVHIVRRLTQDLHDVVFLSEPNANHMADVRKIAYVSQRASDERIHEHAREFEIALRRAEAAAVAARQIKALGFVPDIIIGHHGWGELLNMQDVFPSTPLLGYFEFYYNLVGQDVDFDPEFPVPEHRLPMVRAKNAVNLAALSLPGAHGQTPTEWQLDTYPGWGRSRITLLREGVDLAQCSPAAPRASRRLTLPDGFRLEAKHKLVTYMSRNLEPYRGFHIFMRALPALLAARPDLHVSLVGNDLPGYGALPEDGSTWRDTIMREMNGKIDLARVHFLGQVPYETHIALLRRSDAHVYFTYPFVASWSLREAMAVGAPIIGSDTPPVREFITHERTGLLTPFLEPGALADSVLRLLDDPGLCRRLRTNARLFAEAHLDREAYLSNYATLIERLTGRSLKPPQPTSPKAAKLKPALPKATARKSAGNARGARGLRGPAEERIAPWMVRADAPPPMPVIEAPAGVRFDFNEGARVALPARAAGLWRVRLSDVGTGNMLYDATLAGGMVMSAKKWFFRCRVEVFDGETLVLDHTYDARGRDVLIRFHIGTLGDLIAWFPFSAAFATLHGCRLTCCMSALIIPLFRDAYPHLRFVTPAEADDRPYYATYKMMMFFGDRDRLWNTCEGRTLSLQENAAYLLGIPPGERRPMLSLPDESRPIAERYACIATQATGQAKYWNNPDGWDQTLAFLKGLGLRVICIDQKPVTAVGHVRNAMPRAAEDETGDRPLVERARWLRHATVFVGLSSGLSWLAWAAGAPVVMISGFTHPTNEFTTPYRVINWHACNGCWNDDTAPFDAADRADFLWCPRHKDTPRMFECSRLITAHQVIGALRRVPAIAALPGANTVMA